MVSKHSELDFKSKIRACKRLKVVKILITVGFAYPVVEGRTLPGHPDMEDLLPGTATNRVPTEYDDYYNDDQEPRLHDS